MGSSSHSGSRGFALLITVTLLAFLVLLLVSLASFTRVETQVAANGQTLNQARQNALFALHVAIGQLQKHAGPDQRVTAPSKAGSNASVPGRSDSRPHWTGAWKEASPANLTVNPELQTWLVSGNETTPTAVKPSDTIADPTTANNSPTIWLLNTATVTAPAGAPSAINPDTRVKLVKKPITATVPGFSGTVTVGNYAWWVGDEGVKAHATLLDPFAARPAEQIKRLQSVQQSRPDRMTGLNAFPHNAAGDAVVAATLNTRLTSVLTHAQLNLAVPSVTVVSLRDRYHDLGVGSRGVLSDTLHGGLRRDLTQLAALSDSDFHNALSGSSGIFCDINPAYTATTSNPLAIPGTTVPAGITQIWSDTVLNHATGGITPKGNPAPTWEQLRSFIRLADNVDSSGVITPRTQTASQHGVGPILVSARLFFGFSRTATATPGQYRMSLHLRPAFVLANPYSVTLRAAQYAVAFDAGTGWVAVAPDNPSIPNDGDRSSYPSVNYRDVLGNVRFLLDAPALAPGEARIFTLGGDATWADNSRPVLVNDYNPGFSLKRELTAPVTQLPNAEFTDAQAQSARLYTSGTTLGAILWGPSPGDYTTILQRIVPYTYSPASPAVGDVTNVASTALGVSADGTIRWGGGFIMRYASASDYSGTASDNRLNINFVKSVNPRAPVISAMSGTAAYFPLRYPFKYDYDAAFAEAQSLLPDFKRAYWMLSHDPARAPLIARSVLFDVPRSTARPASIGALRHFNAGGFITPQSLSGAPSFDSPLPDAGAAPIANESLAVSPSGVIGNSRAHPYVRRDHTTEDNFTDQSYLLNTVLWDRFFFSSVPQDAATYDFNRSDNTALDGSSIQMVNARYRPFRPDSFADIALYRATPAAAASNLLVDGAFNVNSLSVEAWKAILSGPLGVPYTPTETVTERDDTLAPLPRTLTQPLDSASSVTGINDRSWAGYRRLTTAQLDALATSLVAEVQKRGPFLSLADFVNRRLVLATASGESTDLLGVRGPVEAAIETAGINAGVDASLAALQPSLITPGTTDDAHREPNAVAGFPGWLTQADVLEPLAPILSARSDTFKIRAYGDCVNPATSQVDGRAWCEAIVQRLPDFVDSTQPPETPVGSLNATNLNFGRRFVIVSIRWLTAADI